MSFSVTVSETAEDAFIYSMADAQSGQCVISCLQDLAATDIFLFTTSRLLGSTSVLEALDGLPGTDFIGVAFCNFLENECVVKNAASAEICAMRSLNSCMCLLEWM